LQYNNIHYLRAAALCRGDRKAKLTVEVH
jgi:hypothetical protein